MINRKKPVISLIITFAILLSLLAPIKADMAVVNYLLPTSSIVWENATPRFIGSVQSEDWTRTASAYAKLADGTYAVALSGTSAKGVKIKVFSNSGVLLSSNEYVTGLSASYFTKSTITVKQMILTEDQSLVVVGEESGTASLATGSCSHGFIMKIDISDYSMTYAKKILHPDDVSLSYKDLINAVIETDQGYFVAGRFLASSGKYFAFIEGYDKSNGDTLFIMDSSQMVSGEHDEFFSLIETGDGGFIAVGKSNSPLVPGYRDDNMLYRSSSYDPYVAMHDGYVAKFSAPSDGLIQREAHKCYGTIGYDYIRKIIQTSDGFIFFAEYDNDLDNYGAIFEINGYFPDNVGPDDIYIQKINPLGETAWIKPVGSANTDTYNEIIDARPNLDGTFSFVGLMGNQYNYAPGGDVISSYSGSNLWVATFEPQDSSDPAAAPDILSQYVVCAYRYPLSYEVLPPDISDNYTAFILAGINSNTSNQMVVKTAKQILADLSASLSLKTSSAKGGDKIDIDNVVANLGPDSLVSATVEITVTPSDAFTNISVTDYGLDTSTVLNNVVTLNLNSIATSATRTTGIELTTKSDFSGTLTVQSAVTLSGGTDSILTNNEDTITVDVAEKETSCDTFVTASYMENEKLGEYTGYIVFGNKGPDVSVNTVLTCRLDKNTDFVSAFPDTYTIEKDSSGFDVVTWDVNNLAAGYTNYIEDDPSSYYKVVCALKPGVIRGTLLSNKHNIVSETLDTEEEAEGSQNEKTVWFGMLPDLSLQINAPNAHIHTFTTGDYPYEYTVTLTNNGIKEAKDVVMTVSVPQGLESGVYYPPDISGLSHSYDSVQRIVTINADTLGAGDNIQVRITGELHSWYQDNNYSFTIDAAAKGKSNAMYTQYDLNTVENKQVSIYRPDIAVTYSYPDDTEGQYIYIDQESGDNATKKVRIEIENIGQGNSQEFYVDITLHDPSDSFTLMKATAYSENVSRIDKMDLEGKVYRVKISDPMCAFLGLTGTYSNARTDDNKKAFIEFELTSKKGPYDYDTAIIQVDPYYETIGYFSDTITAIDSFNADPDITNSSALIYLDFYHINLKHWAFGVYQLETASVTQQYNLVVDYINSASDGIDLADLDISQIFSYMKTYTDDSDVYDLYIKYASGSIPGTKSAFGKGILLENKLSVKPESHSFATYIKNYASEMDDTAYANNSFTIEVTVSFRLTGSDVTHTIKRYVEFSIPPSTPTIYTPETGQISNLNKPFDIIGFAMPNAQVKIYDNATKLIVGTTYADSTGKYQYTCSGGLASFYVKAYWSNMESQASNVVNLTESDHCWCPQRSYWTGKAVNGNDFTFKFRNRSSGLPSTSNWSIKGVYGFWDSTLWLYINPDHDPEEVYVIADNVKYTNYYIVGNYYVFDIKSAHNVMIYVDCPKKENSSNGSVLIDPDGFVFDSGVGFTNVVPGAKVTCMVYDPVNTIWYEWPAASYSSQINPQIVNDTGYFAFFTPPGTYRLVVEGPSPYQKWVSPDIVVIADLVTQNIPYQKLPADPVDVSIRVSPDALKDAFGNDKTNITIAADDVVEWISYPLDGATINDISALNTNPVIRIKSSINVEQDISGFDSGVLMPYYTYRFQFKYPGTYTYSYNINNSSLTGTVTVTGAALTDTNLPSTPQNFAVSLDQDNSVLLSWSASTDNQQVAGYKVYRRLSAGGSDFSILASIATTSYRDSTVAASLDYQYKVCAYDASDNFSHASQVLDITTNASTPPSSESSYNPYLRAISCESGTGTIAVINAEHTLNGSNAKATEAMVISLISRAAYFGMTTKKDVIGFKINALQPSVSCSFEIDKSLLELISSVGDHFLKIESDVAALSFDANAIDTICNGTINGTISISMQKLDDHEGRPVYDFTVSNSISVISDFGNGSVRITIPYTLRENEDLNNIVVYILKDDGTLESVRGYYDSSTQTVVIKTSHFSRFVIGCRNLETGNMYENKWYRNALAFVSSRDIPLATEDTQYNPESALTRAQFIVMLMKAYCISADACIAEGFDDVTDTSILPYINKARDLGMVKAKSDNDFYPDEILTRLSMMVMLYDALKAIKELPEAISESTHGNYTYEISLKDDQKKAIDALVAAGIIKGDGVSLMLEKENTQAEFAQVLYNLLTR
ncbi:MAG: hypothetical protein PHC31_02825 [Clostridia bacterium]|nr:hypothetical protein [Clostridia bacterium]